MSTSADPQATVEFRVTSVTGNAADVTARFLTSAERKRLTQLQFEIQNNEFPPARRFEAARVAIELGVVSPSYEKLSATFTDRELCELALDYDDVLDLSEADKGKSRSRLPLPQGASAGSAAEAAATDPAPKAP